MDFCCFYFPLFCIHWLMGNHLLPANPAGYADDIRADTMGFQSVAQMGRGLGEVDDTLPDRAFLWCDALLRGVLRTAPVRHRAVHPGGKPHGDNGQRDNDGGLPAKLFLFGGLPDGGQHRGVEMPEPCAGLSGMDDTGGRYCVQYEKLRRRSGAAGKNVGYRGDALADEIKRNE